MEEDNVPWVSWYLDDGTIIGSMDGVAAYGGLHVGNSWVLHDHHLGLPKRPTDGVPQSRLVVGLNTRHLR